MENNREPKNAPLNPMDPDDLTFDISDNLDKALKNFPDEVAILPLRGVVVYPQTIVPLTIGQPRSIKLIDDVIANNKLVGLVASRNAELENPSIKEMYKIGTVGSIHRLFRAPDGTIRILVQGMARFATEEYIQDEPYFRARIKYRPEIQESNLQVDALARNARDQFERIAELIPTLPRELVTTVSTYTDPLQTAYTISNFQRMELTDAQAILEIDKVSAKLQRLVSILTREREVLELGQKIQNEARSEMEKTQREYFLREQLKAIQDELGEGDEQTADIEEFRTRIEAAHMSEESIKQARRELDRLSRLPTAAAEYGVIRTYLDWLVSLPWSNNTPDNLDISHARQVLDTDHYGLKDVKSRILEYLAVRKLRQDRKSDPVRRKKDEIRKVREGVILCFIGPPGVGKTSLGQSIARAMNRKFIRISLGGVRDEAEIRGHRRTYIGAMPGRILQSMRRVESHNPVFMLDEIDKLRFDFSGDPASALLEVLDPEQNREFRDHYLEVAFDLSQVMFITTANSLETIPPPLLDRMEVIQIAGYTEDEKYHIARQYLIPRQLLENGLRDREVKFSSPAIHRIIRDYTQEAGVRNLERQIGSICRKLATSITEGKVTQAHVTPEYVKDELGTPIFKGSQEISLRTSIPGVATGLAWTAYGGDILFVEATRMPGSKGFMITGSIGNVMQESAQAGLSYVRSHAKELEIPDALFKKSDIHLHIPAGAQPKDGPSAGVTMVTALVSLLRQQPVRHDTGMTGEITLRGQVLPVGGIKEKILAAHRSGLKRVIIPKRNKDDLEELPESVKRSMEFILAESMMDVLQNALLEPRKSRRSNKIKPNNIK
jgi:ATP-dependent Lon protease